MVKKYYGSQRIIYHTYIESEYNQEIRVQLKPSTAAQCILHGLGHSHMLYGYACVRKIVWYHTVLCSIMWTYMLRTCTVPRAV